MLVQCMTWQAVIGTEGREAGPDCKWAGSTRVRDADLGLLQPGRAAGSWVSGLGLRLNQRTAAWRGVPARGLEIPGETEGGCNFRRGPEHRTEETDAASELEKRRRNGGSGSVVNQGLAQAPTGSSSELRSLTARSGFSCTVILGGAEKKKLDLSRRREKTAMENGTGADESRSRGKEREMTEEEWRLVGEDGARRKSFWFHRRS